ncbi:MAG: protein-L-isoaspartate O-methyltransferase [Alphaproteobacteria bacterium]|nr:protein-L-isoaspartate O-methyltransferase [Alphaproteobacteria bacterium]
MMTAFEAARAHMIDSQLRPNKVTDQRVLDAFTRIRRELFVPEHTRALAYIDEDLAVGRGRYLMEPMVAARLIQAAAPKPTETALVVGAGTGYEAAVLSRLVRTVIAIEEDPEFARLAREALVDEDIATVSVVEGRPREGHRPRAPYDVILFGGAITEVPSEITAQLAEDGRLVGVVRSNGSGVGRAILATKTGTVIARRVIFDASIPFLPGFEPKSVFAF